MQKSILFGAWLIAIMLAISPMASAAKGGKGKPGGGGGNDGGDPPASSLSILVKRAYGPTYGSSASYEEVGIDGTSQGVILNSSNPLTSAYWSPDGTLLAALGADAQTAHRVIDSDDGSSFALGVPTAASDPYFYDSSVSNTADRRIGWTKVPGYTADDQYVVTAYYHVMDTASDGSSFAVLHANVYLHPPVSGGAPINLTDLAYDAVDTNDTQTLRFAWDPVWLPPRRFG